jgi:hypothetical protein
MIDLHLDDVYIMRMQQVKNGKNWKIYIKCSVEDLPYSLQKLPFEIICPTLF